MRRREFIMLTGGAGLAWFSATHAQPLTKIHRVGMLFSSVLLTDMMGFDPIDPVTGAFVHRLRELGYVEGQNLVLERRSVEGKFERLDEMATGFVSHKRDV